MKLRSIIEAKQVGVLYHFTSIPRALSIMKDNKLKISTSSRPAISFTRNKNYGKSVRYGLTGGLDVRFTIDGDLLSTRYKVQPYQYHFYDYTDVENKDEAEEIVTKPIENIKRYVLKIDLLVNQEQFEYKLNHEKGFLSLILRFTNDPSYDSIKQILK